MREGGDGWSEQEVETVKEHWPLGFSAGEISRVLGHKGFSKTRNAVIGKIHRLGLTRSYDPAMQNAINARRAAAERKKQPPNPPPLPPAPPDEPKPLGPKGEFAPGCQWIGSDPRLPGWRMCGHERVPGRSYCPFHSKLAYVPAKPKEAATA